jgi:hypothetical protein
MVHVQEIQRTRNIYCMLINIAINNKHKMVICNHKFIALHLRHEHNSKTAEKIKSPPVQNVRAIYYSSHTHYSALNTVVF